MGRKKPTTCKVSLWNVTGGITITTHADEAHKSVALVDLTVSLGDRDTARDLLHGLGNVLDLDENQRDFLSHVIFNNPEQLKQWARDWRGAEILKSS